MKRLLLCILLDLIGLLSYVIPTLGESIDIAWAPLAGIIAKMIFGNVIGTIAFFEEALPYTDLFPTFTAAFLYERYVKPSKREEIEAATKEQKQTL